MMRNTADKLPTPSRDSFILAGWRSAGVPEEDTVVLIAVEGYAAQSHAAQRGTLRLGVTFTQDDRVAVIRATAALHEQIAEQAKAHVASGAATRWGSQSVTASLQWDWERPSPTQEAVQVRRFRAYAPVWVRFSDVAALAAWSLSLAELDGVSVEGITWTLTDDVSRTATEQVRQAAAQDARTRANAYAAGLDLGEVELVALYEQGLRPGTGGGAEPSHFGGGSARMMAASADSGPTLELRAPQIEVAVTLSADFAATR